MKILNKKNIDNQLFVIFLRFPLFFLKIPPDAFLKS
jgi:hypothetical protein